MGPFVMPSVSWKALGTSCHALGTIEKPTMRKHARSWFHNVATYNEEVIEYFTKKFSENSF